MLRRPVAALLLAMTFTASAQNAGEATPLDTAPSATVHISRPKVFVNGGIKPGIVIDGVDYPVLPNGACMSIPVPPGAHTLSLKLSDRYTGADAVAFTVEAGETVHAEVVTGMKPEGRTGFRRVFGMRLLASAAEREAIACETIIDPFEGKRHRKSIWFEN